VVAPLALRDALPPVAGRLIPIVTVEKRDYALLVPSLTALPVTDLRRVIADVADDRERILAALDYFVHRFLILDAMLLATLALAPFVTAGALHLALK
jgi:hypothetical protein